MNLVVVLDNPTAGALTRNGVTVQPGERGRALAQTNTNAVFGFSMNGGVRYAHDVTLAKLATSTALPTGLVLEGTAAILV